MGINSVDKIAETAGTIVDKGIDNMTFAVLIIALIVIILMVFTFMGFIISIAKQLLDNVLNEIGGKIKNLDETFNRFTKAVEKLLDEKRDDNYDG